MTANEARQRFLDYFARHGHKVLPSFPLLPAEDPTLLLINAGMAPLKPYFLGMADPPATRLASSQKCVRVIDIERVGETIRHLTFFEMLGNFSFGDYFKREAIRFGLELLTKGYGLEEERLWVSVYEKDSEAEQLWLAQGFPKERLVRLGKEHNFWMAAETGPCGPDSEIYYDRGAPFGCGRPGCRPGCDCDRFLELWNLVFMQFNQRKDGELEPLPRKNIDTGMGLERLAMIVQDKPSPYETDLFSPVTSYVADLFKKSEHPSKTRFLRVVSDHARASGQLISDGILPSNESRGYVLRRLIRRCVRIGKSLGVEEPYLYRTAAPLIEIYGDVYPELAQNEGTLTAAIKEEEARFLQTLDQGERLLFTLMDELKEAGKTTIPGEEAFRLYDTYGYPYELTEEVAKEQGFRLDREGFEREMTRQRERAKKAAKGGQGAWDQAIPENLPAVTFVGYETLSSSAKAIKLFRDGKEVDRLEEGEEGWVILDTTPFYAEGGGQVGDHGKLYGDTCEALVKDTQKVKEGVVWHKTKITRGVLQKDAAVQAVVDEKARMETARHHTATHLLQAVLREVLGKEVRQAGSLVCDSYLRFDFTFHRPLTREELAEIERRMNEYVLRDIPVTYFYTDIEDAMRRGAIAFFGEKYGKKVRVVQIGEVSMELCGGTHLRRTLQIGFLRLTREESIGAGIRRVEAVCGRAGAALASAGLDQLQTLAERLQVKPSEVLARVGRLIQEMEASAAENKMLQEKILKGEARQLARNATPVGKLRVVTAEVPGLPPLQVRQLAELIKAEGVDVALVGSAFDESKVYLAAVASPGAGKSVSMKTVVQKMARVVGGSGGGKDLAGQGGGKNPLRLAEALQAGLSELKSAVGEVAAAGRPE